MSTSREELKERMSNMIAERNYVAAYLAIKDSGLSDVERHEYTGTLVTKIVDELGDCSRRNERERVTYLRSLLAWIFRDVPGLSSLYREQLRLANTRGDLASDVYQGFKNFNEIASGRKGVSEGIEETVDQVRRNLEDAADNLRAGDAGESVRSFVSAAETGIRDGLTQMGRIFEQLNQASTQRRPETDTSDDDDEVGRKRSRGESDFEDAHFEERVRQEAEDVEVEIEDEDEND